MRRLGDLALELDRPFPDGAESLVRNAHLVLADRYLGYESFAPLDNDLRAVTRALTELLAAPPEIDMVFLATLFEWAATEPASVRVAAEWAASLLLRSLDDEGRGVLADDLLGVYWGDGRVFALGHATDWLVKHLGQVDGYDHPRGVRRSFVYNALDFAPHVEMLCAPLGAARADAEGEASARVAEVLDRCPLLESGLAQGSGESSAQLVSRAKMLFRAHEAARRRSSTP